jgi:hypothetical protein
VIYGYRCRTCGVTRDSTRRDDVAPCPCGGLSSRDFSSVQFGAASFTPHFNHSVGAVVNSDREFDDLLKRRSEENSLATGADHSYTRIDPGDLPSHPHTDEGLEETARTRHDKGMVMPRALR